MKASFSESRFGYIEHFCLHYTFFAVDVWSVGCIFAELLSRKILFQAQSPVQQVRVIT